MSLIFIGDELVAGYGDSRASGWIGRVLSHTHNEPPFLSFTLAMPGESIGKLAERWKVEVPQRMEEGKDNRLIVGLGSHGLSALSVARARLHLANILDGASKAGMTSFVVGPPPRRDLSPNLQSDFTNAYAEVCGRREVPFVDTFTPLLAHEQWNSDLALADRYTPSQAGYGLLAWLVLHNGWNTWLGVPPTN